MSPPVSHEILGVFVYTLTSDGKYPIQDCENLQLPIQMQLSEKPKIFSQYCVPFLESIPNFNSFEKKKNDHHRQCISKIKVWENFS